MSAFVLIDLESQFEAVQQHVSGWEVETVISWMERFGSVERKSDAFGRRIYLFQSSTGKKAIFFFDENNHLTVVKTGWKMY